MVLTLYDAPQYFCSVRFFYSVNLTQSIKITVFSKKKSNPIEYIDLLSSNLKRYFTSDYFL